MELSVQKNDLVQDIKHNCDISDARDHGIYSMCTLVLKLRNLYKWENGIEPWDEPEPADLLDWIEAKERYWETIVDEDFKQLGYNGSMYTPDDCTALNAVFKIDNLVYGAGHGRSMKAVFFLAEMLEKRTVSGCPVLILGQEAAKEMASPFAMTQDGVIYIRKEPLRFFLWDQIQELRSSCRISFRRALEIYGLLHKGELDNASFRRNLDKLVERELDLFIYHEVGEILQTTLSSATLQKIITTFPSSIIELVCRSIKDILADTHPQGVLTHIISMKRESTLSLYVGLLDGMRKELFPEIHPAWNRFNTTADWQVIEDARLACRDKMMGVASLIEEITEHIDDSPVSEIEGMFNSHILAPLNLGTAS